MSSTVQDIVSGLRNPVAVQRTDTVQKALSLMSEHDYSQLPVVDADNHPLGMVTSDSILRALSSFGTTLDILRVEDASVDAKSYTSEDDLFDLLNDLRDKYAVLIVDEDGTLQSIVTAFDATEYFRQSAENLMIIRDIESNLKQRIQLAFTQPSGNFDQDALHTLIQEIIDPSKGLNSNIRQAISRYLEFQGNPKSKLNEEWFQKILTALHKNTEQKSFDDLTFHEYASLIFAGSQWSRYEHAFGIGKPEVQHLLDGVREARNQLAHFRGDLTAQQRDQIRYARKWLEQHQPGVPEPEILPVAEIAEPGAPAADTEEIIPLEEADENRYAALGNFLRQRSSEVQAYTLRFSDVETIINHALPPSAWEHRSWWANDSVGHVQSQEWLNAGWRVSALSITSKTVTFTRMVEREEAYIKFFSAYKEQLHKVAGFKLRDTSPDGHSWFNAVGLPFGGAQLATITAAFARGKRFRIELYIDTGVQEENKHVFDEIHAQHAEIEELIGAKLSWERIDHKRASRVALYYDQPVSITSDDAELKEACTWAVDNTITFYNAIASRADQSLKSL